MVLPDLKHNDEKIDDFEAVDDEVISEKLQAEMGISNLQAEVIIREKKKGKTIAQTKENGAFIAESNDGQKKAYISGTMMDTSFNANDWRATQKVIERNSNELDSSTEVRVQHSRDDWDMVGKLDMAAQKESKLDYVVEITDSEAVRKFEEGTWNAQTMGVSPGMDQQTVSAECSLCGEAVFDAGEHCEASDHEHMKGFDYDGETAKLVVTDGLVGELSLTANPAYGGVETGSIDEVTAEDNFSKQYIKAQKEQVNDIIGENQMTDQGDDPDADGDSNDTPEAEEKVQKLEAKLEELEQKLEAEEDKDEEDEGGDTEEAEEEEEETEAEGESKDELSAEVQERLEQLEATNQELQDKLEAEQKSEWKKQLAQYIPEEDAEDIVAEVESEDEFEARLKRFKKVTAEKKGSMPHEQQTAEDEEVDKALKAEAGKTVDEMVDTIVAESDYRNPEDSTEADGSVSA